MKLILFWGRHDNDDDYYYPPTTIDVQSSLELMSILLDSSNLLNLAEIDISTYPRCNNKAAAFFKYITYLPYTPPIVIKNLHDPECVEQLAVEVWQRAIELYEIPNDKE